MTTNKEIVNAAIEKANKTFGKGIARNLGEESVEDIEAISTGSKKLDNTLGIGGFPKGRITDLFGNEGSGKSSLTMHAIAEAQKEGAVAAFIDAEQAFTPTYAEQLGVNLEELVLIQPDYGEQALDIVDSLLDTDKMDIIIVDSVPALVPKAELEGDLEDQQVALQARMMSKALRRFKNKVRKTDTALIFINQIRSTMNSGWGGPSEKATGGKALKFYSDVRLEVKRGKSIKSGKQIMGHMLKVQAIKNKLAPPFRKCEIPFIYGEGIDLIHDLLRTAKDAELITRSGAWYYYKEDQIGQGKDAAKDFIRENKEQIENDLKEPQTTEEEE